MGAVGNDVSGRGGSAAAVVVGRGGKEDYMACVHAFVSANAHTIAAYIDEVSVCLCVCARGGTANAAAANGSSGK